MMKVPTFTARGSRRRARWLLALAVLALAGCASAPPPRVAVAPPNAAARQALAPTGALRVGVHAGHPMSLMRQALTRRASGLVHDLGAALAERLGVQFRAVELRNQAEVIAALKRGEIDLAGDVITQMRAAEVDFAESLVEIDFGFLVPPRSPVQSVADMQRMGFRVGVFGGAWAQGALPRAMPNAVVLPSPGLRAAGEALARGEIEAFASNKPVLLEMADSLPGSRVLAERWSFEAWSLVVPKRREAGLSYLNQFLAQARNEGLVEKVLQDAGLRGLSVARH